LDPIQSKIQIKNIDLLILDPPRSGFKGLEEISKTYSVKNILYVSCNPSTLARDLASIKEKFKIKEVHLLDFFPSTYHFETLVILKHS
jgi:23S rRNA (uracil1939-C5)-methyltransferase